jgi:hypothetical protein
MNGSASSTVQAHASSSSSSGDTSPFDEKRPIPIPRKMRPIMGGQMLFMNKGRSETHLIERDSLNSYNYEGDEDEVFDEIDCIAEQSPCSDQHMVRKR